MLEEGVVKARKFISASFKEWNSVVEALGRGEQMVILRKGGIIEDEGDFIPKEKEFILFPTFTHERPELLKKFFKPDEPIDRDKVVIKYWADTVLAKRLEDEKKVLALSPYHIWKDEVVLERFHRWGKDEVWCLFVRVYKLSSPVLVDMSQDYAGCKSWIQLNLSIDVSNSYPVIPDDVFERRLDEIGSIFS